MEKNVYLNNKNHLINLNILNFVINTNYKLKDFLETIRKILNSKTYELPVDGKYLMDNGMKQGALIGKVLENIEEEWIRNNFKITKDQILQAIKLHSN